MLAYGTWGLVAGRPSCAVNKGNPPAIGVGPMKKLARNHQLEFFLALGVTASVFGGWCRFTLLKLRLLHNAKERWLEPLHGNSKAFFSCILQKA